MRIREFVEHAGMITAFAIGAIILYYGATALIANRQQAQATSAYNSAIAGYDSMLQQQQQSDYLLGSLNITEPAPAGVTGSATTTTLSSQNFTPPIIALNPGVSLS